MSTREPLWYCHECHAEMRPLMQPDPHCASCNGTFVEKIENPQDDPREFDRIDHDFAEDMPGIPPILMGLLSGMNPPAQSPGSRGGIRSAPGSPPVGGTGFRFEMTSGSGPSARTYILGGPNRLERPEPLERTSSFMRRADQPPEPGAAHDISGPMMAQYLMALLGAPGGRGGEFGNIFGIGGPDSGRWGDYAFSQEALDRIVTELMENSNAHRPVGASEEVMDKLPREVLEDGSPLLEKDCAVCKEQFALKTEDPDEQIVVSLPCKHPFHQPCIIPWLKTSATCPVCRFALVPQPEQHGASGQANQPAGPSGGNAASEQPPPQQRSSSPSANTGGSGLLGSLLGMMLPGHSSSNNTWGGHSDNNSQGNGGSSSGERNSGNLPGGWRES